MLEPLVLAIDVGTSNLKVGIVNQRGHVLAMERSRIPVHCTEPGMAEHDPEELFQLMVQMSRKVAAEFSASIQMLVLSTYHFGVLFLDSEQKPLGGISLLSDMRARASFELFKETVDTQALYQRTGCPPLFQYPLARLFHFKQQSSPLLAQARWIVSAKDFLLLKLSGELLTEPSVSAATQMLNTRSLQWDESSLQVLGINSSYLPRIVDGGSTVLSLTPKASQLLGLPTSTKVLPGLYDGGALGVGLSGLRAKTAVINIGTSAMLRVPGADPLFDQSGNFRVYPYPLFSGTYFNGGALNNAALPLDWLKEKLFDIDLKELVLLEDEHDSAPLFAVPYLTGERNARIGSSASGVFFGLRNHHGQSDLARSLMEGVAFSLRMLRDALCENKVEIEELRLAGGGTVWKSLPHIIANVFNSAIYIPKTQEIALVGSAMMGFKALGIYHSLDEAYQAMMSSGDRIEPSPMLAARYAERFAFFEELCDGLAPLFEKHQKLKS